MLTDAYAMLAEEDGVISVGVAVRSTDDERPLG